MSGVRYRQELGVSDQSSDQQMCTVLTLEPSDKTINQFPKRGNHET